MPRNNSKQTGADWVAGALINRMNERINVSIVLSHPHDNKSDISILTH